MLEGEIFPLEDFFALRVVMGTDPHFPLSLKQHYHQRSAEMPAAGVFAFRPAPCPLPFRLLVCGGVR